MVGIARWQFILLDIAGFEVSPGVWVAPGAEVDTDAVLTGPLCIGEYAKIEAGAQLREFTVIGNNVVVKEGAFLHRAVVHNNVYVGQGATLRGCRMTAMRSRICRSSSPSRRRTSPCSSRGSPGSRDTPAARVGREVVQGSTPPTARKLASTP